MEFYFDFNLVSSTKSMKIKIADRERDEKFICEDICTDNVNYFFKFEGPKGRK